MILPRAYISFVSHGAWDFCLPLNSEIVVDYDVVFREIAVNQYMRRVVKLAHPVCRYEFLLLLTLGDRASTELVGLGTDYLAVNLGCDPVECTSP